MTTCQIIYSNAIPTAQLNGVLCVPILKNNLLSANAQMVNTWSAGAIDRAVASAGFKGKSGETAVILAPHGVAYSRILLFVVAETLKNNEAVELGAKIANQLCKITDESIHIWCDSNVMSGAMVNDMILGFQLKSYRFDKYSEKLRDEKPKYKKLHIYHNESAALSKAVIEREAIYQGAEFTRDLVSEPANVLSPLEFANRCLSLEVLGVKVEILKEKELKNLGMNALLGVGQGSHNETCVVVMRWNGVSGATTPPIALVGKGVCFDSGGISLKAGPGMEEMIWDMAGAGAVAGTMKALALRHAPINVVGVLGLVENMPDGMAQRPGDIVKSMSGKTIDIHNTDAEGRLVLADVLWYTQEKYNPSEIIDLATLTGAMIIALGHEHAGVFSNDDKLSQDLIESGLICGEKLWRMPLGDAYDKAIDSPRADMKNIGSKGAGSIIGAQFIQRFIKPNQKWAHLDIAGMVWSGDDKILSHRGATGYGVRLLNQFIKSRQ